ncbi:hypothetical protein Mmc1_0411 [Magnetococcus marinus MC-1]|uniref:STAS domain-containing protein n=1 Tax=Magnetococcus marinus (strain ATCC BAA-1437 / JCM 17883 / MC-1) TaxID=156889 RepID=A0L4P4_MAGMM|nr:STAS domain-containing protein [Magnetococcus marinus]ABK42937.1 hypothetical protein Mmc1_0411 [Magnetococcus marinus MC-1]
MLECIARIENDRLTICLPRDFSNRHYPSFRASYKDHPNHWHYIIDCLQVTHLDSGALGMFLLLAQHIGTGDGHIRCINCKPLLAKQLQAAGFAQLLTIETLYQGGGSNLHDGINPLASYAW